MTIADGGAYIPMARGFVYLAVVLTGATRRVLSWRLSITMEAAFCVETLEDGLRHSQSLAKRRQRLSQAMVRSTIQRFGKTTNPLT
jgi:transposase InsO family protein